MRRQEGRRRRQRREEVVEGLEVRGRKEEKCFKIKK